MSKKTKEKFQAENLLIGFGLLLPGLTLISQTEKAVFQFAGAVLVLVSSAFFGASIKQHSKNKE